MDNRLEIATFRANCFTVDGMELSWLFSRTQLEFILKDIEVFPLSPLVLTAQYGGIMLPVTRLESYFGLENREHKTGVKYLVMRTVANKELFKLIIETPLQVKVTKLEGGCPSAERVNLPENRTDVLGFFTLQDGTVGVMPDISKICRRLEWRRK